MQYGTFNFIPWLVADGLPTKPETDELVEAFIQPEVLGAPGVVAAEQRTGRCAAHTIMLCALRRPLTSFCDKRPDLIRVSLLRLYDVCSTVVELGEVYLYMLCSLSVSLSLPLVSLSVSLCLSLSLSLSHSLTLSLSHSLTRSLAHSLPLSLSPSRSFSEHRQWIALDAML